MFIQIITENENEQRQIVINTSQIVLIDGNLVAMSTGDKFYLTAQSEYELKEGLYGPATSANPKATAHTADLLNELHTLLGGRGEAKPTTDRKARLKARLKDFSEDELKIAAKNCGSDEFMSGANEQNKRYATLDYLLRTSANVNKWLEEQPQKKKGMF